MIEQARQMWCHLRDARERGCPTPELNRKGITDPVACAQLMADKGVDVRRIEESWGVRYWLGHCAPEEAERVRPQRVAATAEQNARGRGENPPASAGHESSDAPSSARPSLVTFRDYSTREGYRMGWQRVPLDEDGHPIVTMGGSKRLRLDGTWAPWPPRAEQEAEAEREEARAA